MFWQMLSLVGFLSLAMLGLSWLQTNHFPPWISWHSEVAAFAAAFLLALGVLAANIRRGTQTVAIPGLALVFPALMLIAVAHGLTGLATFWGDVWAFGLYMALCLVCVTLGYAAGMGAPRVLARFRPDASERPVALEWLAWALLVGSVASTFVAIAQVFGAWEASSWIVQVPQVRRPGGNLAQSNHLASLIVLGGVSAIFLHQAKRLGNVGAGMFLAVLCLGVAVTESRTGFLSAMVVLLLWLSKSPVPAHGRKIGPGLVTAAGLVAVFAAWPLLLNAMLLTQDAAVRVGHAGEIRILVWRQLVDAILQSPWWGWGIQGTSKALNAVVSRYPQSELFTYSHNIVLDIAVWFGLPVAVVMVGLAGRWLYCGVRSIRDGASWYCVAGIAVVMVHSMVEFPFAYAYFLVPVMFFAGFLEARRGSQAWVQCGIKSTTVCLLAVSGVLVWSVVEYLAVEEDFRVLRGEMLRIGKIPDDYRPPHLILLTQMDALLIGSRFEPRQRMSSDELDKIRDVALRYPWSPSPFRYALALALAGQQQEAARQFLVIRAQRGEAAYKGIQEKIQELAQGPYPELRDFKFP